MTYFYRNTRVTVRKSRICEGCLRKIEKGEKAHSIAGNTTDFYSYYFCLECKEFADKHPGYCFDDQDGSFTPGDVLSGLREYERHQQEEAARRETELEASPS